jgi:hypothetical protein
MFLSDDNLMRSQIHSPIQLRLLRSQDLRRQVRAIPVPEEIHTGLLALHSGEGLDPLANMHIAVQRFEETDRTALDVCAVMLAHDGLDGLGGLVGMVERNGADVVVQNVGLDDAVEELAADKAEFAVDGGGGAAGVGPGSWGVVREGGVGVLQEGNCD